MVTFNSLGDIITLCLLVKSLIDALNSSRGSSKEYQEAIRELSSLTDVLAEVEHISQAHKSTAELNSLCGATETSVQNCRRLVENFSKRVKKYDTSLGDQEDNQRKRFGFLTITGRKLQWRAKNKEELAKFRAEIKANTEILNILMSLINTKLQSVNLKSLESTLRQSNHEVRGSLAGQNAALSDISRITRETKLTLATTADSMNGIVSQRPNWTTLLLQEMNELRSEIAATFESCKLILRAQNTAPAISPAEETFILEDALGRTAPVSLLFIDSWEALHYILVNRFRKRQGHRKIINKEYIFQNRATRKDIECTMEWEKAFLPDMRVDMSMLFAEIVDERTAKFSTTTCPNCRHEYIGIPDPDIECDKCGMWYRRIEEVEDETSTRRTQKDDRKYIPDFSSQGSSGPIASETQQEDDISWFRRVRLRRIRKIRRLEPQSENCSMLCEVRAMNIPEPTKFLTLPLDITGDDLFTSLSTHVGTTLSFPGASSTHQDTPPIKTVKDPHAQNNLPCLLPFPDLLPRVSSAWGILLQNSTRPSNSDSPGGPHIPTRVPQPLRCDLCNRDFSGIHSQSSLIRHRNHSHGGPSNERTIFPCRVNEWRKMLSCSRIEVCA